MRSFCCIWGLWVSSDQDGYCPWQFYIFHYLGTKVTCIWLNSFGALAVSITLISDTKNFLGKRSLIKLWINHLDWSQMKKNKPMCFSEVKSFKFFSNILVNLFIYKWQQTTDWYFESQRSPDLWGRGLEKMMTVIQPMFDFYHLLPPRTNQSFRARSWLQTAPSPALRKPCRKPGGLEGGGRQSFKRDHIQFY